jgi:purine-binding chemotaxis protein CheW
LAKDHIVHDIRRKEPQGEPVRLVRFEIDGQGYALRLEVVERVIRAIELSPLPGAPAVIRGIFSLGGKIVAVADPRRRLGLADRDIELEDRIVITRTPARVLGLLAHGDADVTECAPEDIVRTETVIAGDQPLEGIGKLPDGLIFIHDLSKFLSIEEERLTDEAMRARG